MPLFPPPAVPLSLPGPPWWAETSLYCTYISDPSDPLLSVMTRTVLLTRDRSSYALLIYRISTPTSNFFPRESGKITVMLETKKERLPKRSKKPFYHNLRFQSEGKDFALGIFRLQVHFRYDSVGQWGLWPTLSRCGMKTKCDPSGAASFAWCAESTVTAASLGGKVISKKI